MIVATVHPPSLSLEAPKGDVHQNFLFVLLAQAGKSYLELSIAPAKVMHLVCLLEGGDERPSYKYLQTLGIFQQNKTEMNVGEINLPQILTDIQYRYTF